MWKYIFSIIALGYVLNTYAQDQGQQGAQGEDQNGPLTMKDMRELRKQEPKDWSIQYVKLSYDIMPQGRQILFPDQKGLELQLSTNFYKYFVMLEGGYQDITRDKTDFLYQCDGTFWRLGPEVNMIKPNDQGGAFTFGLRYAHSSFQDQMSYTRDLGFGETNYQYANKNATANWIEAVSGINLALTKNIHMGYTVRLKLFKSVKGTDLLEPFDIPGYGRYQKDVALGFSYYIGWAIPFKKGEAAPASAF